MPIFYRKKTDALIKLNQLDKCINFFKDIKKSSYYRNYSEYAPKTWFKDIIDELLEVALIKKLMIMFINQENKRKIKKGE